MEKIAKQFICAVNLEVKYFATNYQIGPSQSGLVSSGQKRIST